MLPTTVAHALIAVLGAALSLSSGVRGAGVCGSGYSLVGHYSKKDDVTDKLSMYVDIYYSSGAKRNCLVVEHAGATYGVTKWTEALIRPTGRDWPACNSTGCDRGHYSIYAGPVY